MKPARYLTENELVKTAVSTLAKQLGPVETQRFLSIPTARKADARISGSGGMELSVEDRLDARVSGSGSVIYKGNPRINTSVSGSGSVRSR